ncbi:nucleotide exchange factor GrpE [Paenalkalicoccus suaedae]|uniref:Protein GrpE n=1 Tax=Paenalkalicoccus suaedae TaxID=2592382 RepID=A0A859FKA1_9BACI|nr:nucleotide exchange factor GrpE [Paenalkalicoccus suaedae]
MREVKELTNEKDHVHEEEATEDQDVVLEEEAEFVETDAEEVSQPSEIEELEAKVEEATNKLLRTQADYDNFRRRTKQEKEAAAKYRSQSLAESLIPAVDNFERALSVEVESEDAKSLLKGMEMVHKQLIEALKNEGVEQMETVGEAFDPHKHQAVMQVESDEHESNTIIEELQKGYILQDKVIRPAMVKVSS